MIEKAQPRKTFAVFLRAANVGGHQVFKPSAFARDLSALGCKNIGAAGTFVFTAAASEAKLRAAIAKALPFKPEMAVVEGSRIDRLVTSLPFGPGPLGPGEKAFVSALVAPPKARPRLPISRPEAGTWQLRIIALNGPFVLSVRRTKEPGKFYPNEVVEKAYGVPATTRGWSTVEAVRAALHNVS
jgi:uncharacterized protein (DUF1697 family)